MVAYNFKKRFANDVEAGRKRQTIRAGEPRCKVGDALQLYTGMRTKACRKLRDAVCAEVRTITITHEDHTYRGHGIILNRQRLETPADGRSLARADGFENVYQMCQWFDETHGLPFDGHVVNW